MRNRAGYTVLELTIVCTTVGLIMAIVVPSVKGMSSAAEMGTLQQTIASYATVAREAAVQRGRPTTLSVMDDSVWVTTTNAAGATVILRNKVGVDPSTGITLQKDNDVITFDRRGYTNVTTSNKAKFIIRHGTARDTVCITRGGQVKIRGCA
jgi:Tfp pilus assembly protein FimT